MGYRKFLLVDNQVYHVFTRSIAGYNVFRNENDYKRMIELIDYYRMANQFCKYSRLIRLKDSFRDKKRIKRDGNSKRMVEIIAYCLMPTHIHFILKQVTKNGISEFMNLILKSYSKYFNIKYERKGPLWESRFKNVLVENNDQLLHLTRYIHLNPVSIALVNNPEDWKYSSYMEYLKERRFCNYSEYIDLSPGLYKEFVDNNKDYQKELQKIKSLITV